MMALKRRTKYFMQTNINENINISTECLVLDSIGHITHQAAVHVQTNDALTNGIPCLYGFATAFYK